MSRSRIRRRTALLLFVAMLCGALGGSGIVYYIGPMESHAVEKEHPTDLKSDVRSKEQTIISKDQQEFLSYKILKKAQDQFISWMKGQAIAIVFIALLLGGGGYMIIQVLVQKVVEAKLAKMDEAKDNALKLAWEAEHEIKQLMRDTDQKAKEIQNRIKAFQRTAAAKLDESIEQFNRQSSEIKSEIESAQQEIAEHLENAKADLANKKEEAERMIEDARNIVGDMRRQSQKAHDLYAGMKELNEEQLARLLQRKRDQPDAIGRATANVDRPELHGKLWPVGKTLRVRFLDGMTEQHREVAEIASEWTKHGNIHFEFGSNSEDAEIRMSFSNSGSWSYIGTDSLGVAQHDPTINFAWIDPDTVLHEFGHVLGLIHENNSPNANLVWNKEEVVNFLKGPPNYWTKDTVDKVVFQKEEFEGYREFDPDSIMFMYGLLRFVDSQHGERGIGELSESDKTFIAKLYPKTTN